MKTRVSFSIITSICLVVLTGCVSNSGQPYHDLQTSGALAPSNGKAMVFIYNSENGIVGSGNPGVYVFANDVLLPGRLPNNSFISYEASPGPLTIAIADQPDKASPTSDVIAGLTGGALGFAVNRAEHHRYGVDLNVVAGQTYYFKSTGRLHQMSTEQGENEIKGCKWQNAQTNGSPAPQTSAYFSSPVSEPAPRAQL